MSMLHAQPYRICFSQGKRAKRLHPAPPSPSPGRLDSLYTPKGFCSLPFQHPLVQCVCWSVSPPPPSPFPLSFPPSEVSQHPCCCSEEASDPPPPPPSAPGWVQGLDFHFNSRLSAEASPPPRQANKEPTVRGRDVQPALTSPLSSMGLFSPPAEAQGAGLVGGRLPALGNMPLILSSPSLSPLKALWSIRGLFDSQLVFMWCRGNKKGRDKSNWSGSKGWGMR